MFGGIIAAAIAFWFYRTAESRGLPNFQWAAAGLLSFYIPNFIWSLAIAKPMMNTLHAQNATGTAGLLGYSSVFIGLAVALAVYFLVLKRVAAKSAG
jgi:hypothetical protein